ncbi:MAG: hypothetical protein KKB70_03375 [Proteobacteria bacterium]|nr:hypothetical protein [Pseudomonadota bacterium]MBU1611349.1 hypothetical protein [Pseudomonadota bacterium]
MTLLYNPQRNRIVCRWTEPVKFVMDKKEGVIDKVRTINVSVNKDGKLKSRDKKRHSEHPMFSYVSLFSDELRKINFFTGERPKGACEHCGAATGVVPHFDMLLKELTWRCADPGECSNNE